MFLAPRAHLQEHFLRDLVPVLLFLCFHLLLFSFAGLSSLLPDSTTLLPSLQKSHTHPRTSPPGARIVPSAIVPSAIMRVGPALPKQSGLQTEPRWPSPQPPVSLRLSSFASRRSAMPFPRLASDASGASWSWGSCNARFDHHCLDCLRRSLLLRHDRIELSSPLQ